MAAIEPSSLFAIAALLYFISESRTNENTDKAANYIINQWPISRDKLKRIGTSVGKRGDGFHYGLDMYTDVGNDVYSSSDGKVGKISESERAGIYVDIYSGNEIYRYLHLDRVIVSVGESVKAGQVIAISGRSGIKRSDPHLHFEIRDKMYNGGYGKPVNPLERLPNA